MSAIAGRFDRYMPTVARLTIGLALLWFGTLKLLASAPRPPHVSGLARLLASREVSLGSAVIELALGISMFTPIAGRVLPIVVVWLGVLVGVTAAFLARVVTPGDCGCLGPFDAHPLSRAAMLAGLLLIAALAQRSADTELR